MKRTDVIGRRPAWRAFLQSLAACAPSQPEKVIVNNVKELQDFVFFNVISRFFVSTFSLASRSLASSMDSDPGLGP